MDARPTGVTLNTSRRYSSSSLELIFFQLVTRLARKFSRRNNFWSPAPHRVAARRVSCDRHTSHVSQRLEARRRVASTLRSTVWDTGRPVPSQPRGFRVVRRRGPEGRDGRGAGVRRGSQPPPGLRPGCRDAGPRGGPRAPSAGGPGGVPGRPKNPPRPPWGPPPGGGSRGPRKGPQRGSRGGSRGGPRGAPGGAPLGGGSRRAVLSVGRAATRGPPGGTPREGPPDPP